jgi:hypothetical protein
MRSDVGLSRNLKRLLVWQFWFKLALGLEIRMSLAVPSNANAPGYAKADPDVLDQNPSTTVEAKEIAETKCM